MKVWGYESGTLLYNLANTWSYPDIIAHFDHMFMAKNKIDLVIESLESYRNEVGSGRFVVEFCVVGRFASLTL